MVNRTLEWQSILTKLQESGLPTFDCFTEEENSYLIIYIMCRITFFFCYACGSLNRYCHLSSREGMSDVYWRKSHSHYHVPLCAGAPETDFDLADYSWCAWTQRAAYMGRIRLVSRLPKVTVLRSAPMGTGDRLGQPVDLHIQARGCRSTEWLCTRLWNPYINHTFCITQ